MNAFTPPALLYIDARGDEEQLYRRTLELGSNVTQLSGSLGYCVTVRHWVCLARSLTHDDSCR